MCVCVCVCVCACVCTCIMNLHECASLCTAVRLVGGSTLNRGRVEVYYSGQWRRVCGTSSSFATDEATTVCRDLGYNTLISRTTTYYGYISGAAYISCSGGQSNVSQCSIGTSSCSSSRRGQYVVCGNSSEWMISFAKGHWLYIL